MPRIKMDDQPQPSDVIKQVAESLAQELRSTREAGQPLILEHSYKTGKVQVTVIWDEWRGVPLEVRSATILRAYELAEGPEARERIALASGLTIPEAHAAGMLPYQIIPAIRRGDPVTFEQARQAMLDEGGSQLFQRLMPQLRFASASEAEACRQRLIRRFPASEDIWLIDRDVADEESTIVSSWAVADEA